MPTPTTARGRPILRYHGGKWALAPWIISHFPEHRTYVEPYGGAASVLLRKPRCYAEIYNDLDTDIVNVFRMVRSRCAELEALLRATPYAKDEFIASYERSDDVMEQARRTIVRSFMGFASAAATGAPTGFRARNGTNGGTPPGRDWSNFAGALPALMARLREVVIENKDAVIVMRQHDAPNTLHYVDPPYVTATRCGAAGYRHEMTNAEHGDLAAILKSLRGMVVLSGYPCELYDDLYSSWRRVPRPDHVDGARSKNEVLWLNEAADSALPIPGETHDRR